MAVGIVALFKALGGTSVAAVVVSQATNAKISADSRPSSYLQSRHFAYSHGERFFSAGHTVKLCKSGHFREHRTGPSRHSQALRRRSRPPQSR